MFIKDKEIRLSSENRWYESRKRMKSLIDFIELKKFARKPIENKSTYLLMKRQIEMLVSTLAFQQSISLDRKRTLTNLSEGAREQRINLKILFGMNLPTGIEPRNT